MKTPPFIISFALLFWGLMNGIKFFFLSIILIAINEGSLIIKKKWDFSEKDFSHVTDLCFLILVIIIVYSIFDNRRTALFHVLKLLPCVVFPLFIAQRYSVQGRINVKSLFFIMRKNTLISKWNSLVDISYPYLIICMIGAGSVKTTGNSYFLGIVILGMWALLSIRSRRFSIWSWCLIFLFCTTISWFANNGLEFFYQKLTEYAYLHFSGQKNHLKTITSIGDIGKQKMYNHIMFRVKPGPGVELPLLLREASYNDYESGTWVAVESSLKTVEKKRNSKTWNFTRKSAITDEHHIKIKQYLKDNLLKLPLGTSSISNIDIESLQKNSLGAVKVKGEKSFIDYDVIFGNANPLDSDPNKFDLQVPEMERPALQTVINELKLDGLPVLKKISRLKNFFNNEFNYSLELPGKGNRKTILANFLLDQKAGHCELFATATVLLLRKCGIPSRYAIGFAAEEYSKLEKQIIVRHRHGHAWTLVYVQGKWMDLDTTSSNWIFLEKQQISKLTYINDLFSFIKLKFFEIDWKNENLILKVSILFIFILVILMAKRLKGRKKTRRINVNRPKTKVDIRFQGMESAFYSLEKAIANKGYFRNQSESLLHWSKRIRQSAPALLDCNLLNTIIYSHHKLRFSNIKPKQEDYKKLEMQVNEFDFL